MTTPALRREQVDPATLPVLDDPGIADPGVIYLLDKIPFGGVDASGCHWVVEKTEGWHGPVARRTARSEKAFADGDHRGRAFKQSRRIMLSGICVAPTVGARQGALDRVANVCGDDGTLHTLQVTDQIGRVRTADVELDEGDTPLDGERRFKFQLQLTAPDPRKHGPWQTVAVQEGTLVGQPAAENEFSLHFPATLPPEDNPATRLTNWGTERAFPFFQVTGPCPPFTVRDRFSSSYVSVAAAVAHGEVVSINCDSFAASGFRAHTVWSSTRGALRSSLHLGDSWPSIGPGGAHGRYRIITSTPSSTTRLTVSARSAWH